MKKKTFYIIDGHSQIYRAYFAPMRALTAPSGEPTKATFLFIKQIMQIVRERKPDYLVVTLDGPRKYLWRRDIYPQYKKNRSAAPSDIIVQVDRIKEILKLLDVPIIKKRKYEADDTIATLLTKYGQRADLDIVVVSGDKDLYQSFTDNCSMYNPIKGETLPTSILAQQKGYSPRESRFIQALMGDMTDNIPGVKGIGEKTAIQLITQYGSIRELLKHLDELKPAAKNKIQQASADGTLRLMLKLVTLSKDVPLKFSLEDMAFIGLDYKRAKVLFRILGFKRWE